MAFAWENVASRKEADALLFGVPDDSGSASQFSGAALGPAAIRRASLELESGYRGKKRFVLLPESGRIAKKLFDLGNLEKEHVEFPVEEMARERKMPVCLGGDHSITLEVLRGLHRAHGKKLSLAYFDAHPDLVSSRSGYYGSVVFDAIKEGLVDPRRTVLLATRSPEQEEAENLKKLKLAFFPPTRLLELGPGKALRKILGMMRSSPSSPAYASIDMDCFDPAFAPGVSDPVPGGVSPDLVFYLVRGIAAKGLAGLDVMETNPSRDSGERTSHLAARLVAEALSV